MCMKVTWRTFKNTNCLEFLIDYIWVEPENLYYKLDDTCRTAGPSGLLVEISRDSLG